MTRLCRNGLHPLTEPNIFIDRGQKECRECRKIRRTMYKQRRARMLAKLLRIEREREALQRSDAWHERDARLKLPGLGFLHAEVLAYIRAKGWRTAEPERYHTPLDADIALQRDDQ